MKKVSLIIPVFNSENTLERCVISAISQSYKNLEIILINDGSTDSSLELCNRFAKKDKRIIVIDQNNKGVSFSRNMGIEVSTGDYIMFMDSDDYMEATMIEEMVSAIESTKADVVRCKVSVHNKKGVFDENLNGLHFLKNKQEVINSIKYFVSADVIIPSYVYALIIKKEKIVRFNQELSFMEDTLFYIDTLLNVDSVFFLDKALYHYMYNQASITKNEKNVVRNINSMLNSTNVIKKTLRDYEILDERRMNNNIFYLINTKLYLLCSRNSYRESIEIIKNIFKNDDVIGVMRNIDKDNLSITKKIICFLYSNNLYFFMYFLYRFIGKTISV